MAHCPLLYVHGNHDGRYALNPPEGCLCIEDQILVYNGIRILGLGGCKRYRDGAHQYTEAEMRRRIHRLRWQLRRSGGVDIVVTHAPPRGVGDADDLPHQGFQALLDLIDSYHPQYLFHGHVHLRYGMDIQRENEYHGTKVINACQSSTVDIPDPERRELTWKDRFLQRNIEKIC